MTLKDSAQEFAEKIRNGEKVIFHSEWCDWFAFLCLDGKFLVIHHNVMTQKFEIPAVISLIMQHNLKI